MWSLIVEWSSKSCEAGVLVVNLTMTSISCAMRGEHVKVGKAKAQ